MLPQLRTTAGSDKHATPLSNKRRSDSVLSLAFSAVTSSLVPALRLAGVDQAGTAIVPSAIQVSLLESWALRLLKPVLALTMGRGLAEEKKGAFFYRFGRTDEVSVDKNVIKCAWNFGLLRSMRQYALQTVRRSVVLKRRNDHSTPRVYDAASTAQPQRQPFLPPLPSNPRR